MTNARELPRAVQTAIDLLLNHGQDKRSYLAGWASSTNDEKRNMIEELKTLLGKVGSNASPGSQAVINQRISELRQLQDSLK